MRYSTDGYVLVTGAGSGIGRSLAIKFLKMGYPVVLVGRTREKLEMVKRKIPESISLVIEADVSNQMEVKKMFGIANNWQGNPFIVVSSAGEGIFGDNREFTQSDVEKVMAGNLFGTIFVSQQAFFEMKLKGGFIVNLLSTAANKITICESIYSASKWGAKAYTESLKLSAKFTPVKILSVYPGSVDTPFWDDLGVPKSQKANFMDPNEVAQIIINNVLINKSLWVSELVLNRHYEKESSLDNYILS